MQSLLHQVLTRLPEPSPRRTLTQYMGASHSLDCPRGLNAPPPYTENDLARPYSTTASQIRPSVASKTEQPPNASSSILDSQRSLGTSIRAREDRAHPTFSLRWAKENACENTARLRNFLHFFIAKIYHVTPLPTLSDEDVLYFRRLSALLEAYNKHLHKHGHDGIGNYYNMIDYQRFLLHEPLGCLQIIPPSSRRHQDIEMKGNIQDILWIHAENRKTSSDTLARKGKFGAILEIFEWDTTLIKKVFPYTDDEGRKQALQGLEMIRRRYFEDVDVVFKLDETGMEGGGPRSLTTHSKMLRAEGRARKEVRRVDGPVAVEVAVEAAEGTGVLEGEK